MSDTCSICYRDVDDGVACKDCGPDTDEYVELGRKQERELIANYIEENAVLLSGHVRKPWIRLAASIRACEHIEDSSQQTSVGDRK